MMAFVARCVARWCRVETHRLTTLFQGKMVVVICQTIFKCFVPHVMPKNSGMNTTQENNFQAGWLAVDGEINSRRSVQKNFQAKRPLTPVRIKLKKSVCQFVIVLLGCFRCIAGLSNKIVFLFFGQFVS